MSTLVKERKSSTALAAHPTQQVFAEYMANIIKQIPTPGSFDLLTGTANAQASFYFQSPTTSEINANLYNNILSQRVRGLPAQYGVDQAELTSSVFTNDYNQLYLSIIYQLSPADQALQQQLDAKTAGTITTLRPIWNSWVDAFGKSETPPVIKLDMNDTNVALIQMTAVVQTQWVNPSYVKTLKNDPAYPYVHMNDFDQIFSEIPATVPTTMRNEIKTVYNAQGAAGALTAQVSNATQTLQGIIQNIQHPSTANGGLKLTGSSNMIPGLTFQPADPITLVDELKTSPPAGVLKYSASVTKSTGTELDVEASGQAGISISILDFFSVTVGGRASGSIFEETYAGSKYTVEVVVNNPTLQPLMTVEPLLYNASTAQGWLDSTPVKDAIANGSSTNVTGYVFTQQPNFNFGKGCDFGYIDSMVLSQFLELNITFSQCDSKKVKKYFQQRTSGSIRFLGIPLGGGSQSSSYSYEYSAETASTITVTLKPNPPGYTPGGTDVTQSLCNLVAVGVKYPFA